MALYRSPLTVTLWPSSFLKKDSTSSESAPNTVRADRMRGGRNKFGPMYKRDRARKLQMMRQKQIARAQCQGVVGNEVSPVGAPPFPPPSLPSPSMYSNEPHIKQELIQIPQLSSSTSSPDSSPSPLCTSAQTNSTIAAHFALSVGGPPVMQEPIKVTSWPSNRAPSPPNSGASNHGGRSAGSPKSPFHYGDVGAPLPLTHSLYTGSGKVPLLIKEFQLSMPDDKEWQNQLYQLLQTQTYNQCEVDAFELMCKVIDQSLFAQVDWARNSVFFKELKLAMEISLEVVPVSIEEWSKRLGARVKRKSYQFCDGLYRVFPIDPLGESLGPALS
ncbi:nuclear hormone receptor FTZ-F1 [Trichonephila clavipes]|nr:nuclear hormone receptor FTZ-F1 [Trichonephila clavipes]